MMPSPHSHAKPLDPNAPTFVSVCLSLHVFEFMCEHMSVLMCFSIGERARGIFYQRQPLNIFNIVSYFDMFKGSEIQS